MYWNDVRGSFEAGADAGFPIAMGPMRVIEEVARWRGVDLATCLSVEATASGSEWEVSDPEQPRIGRSP